MFLDIEQAFQQIQNLPQPLKHAGLMQAAGVQFYDQDLRFVARPSVAIIGVGGIPIRDIGGQPTLSGNPINWKVLAQEFLTMAGASAAMSYMNPKGKPLELLGQAVVQTHHHYSVLHTAYLNIGVFGLTSAVEHEFDTQRDLLHLSRITVARTAAQSQPSFVVLNPRHLTALENIVALVDAEVSRLPDAKDLEAVNNLYPALKAHSLILSGTLRNILKLCDQITDQGKEEEYRLLLTQIKALIGPIT